MERRLALLISAIFHPIWMPFYMVLLLFQLNLNGPVQYSPEILIYVFAVIFLNTLILPIILIWLMKRIKLIHSMSMDQKQDRILPFFIIGIFYLSTWLVFENLDIFPYLSFIFLVSTILLAASLLITFFWKISVHSVSMGAISTAVLFLTASHFIEPIWPVYFVFLLSGIIGYARLKVQAHSPHQVYLGFILGCISLMLSILLFV